MNEIYQFIHGKIWKGQVILISFLIWISTDWPDVNCLGDIMFWSYLLRWVMWTVLEDTLGSKDSSFSSLAPSLRSNDNLAHSTSISWTSFFFHLQNHNEEEDISVECCQPPPCRQYVLHSEQDWMCPRGGGATSPCGPCVVRSKMNKDQVPVEGRGLGPGSGPCTGNPFPVEIQTDTTENITFPLLRWQMVTSNKSEEWKNFRRQRNKVNRVCTHKDTFYITTDHLIRNLGTIRWNY